MDQVPGFMAEFDRAMVVHKDIRYFAQVRDELISLSVEFDHLNHLELLINGYDDDERSLYEVPEVRRWVRLIHEQWPDFLFWLTPASLWTCMLSLNPEMHQRLPDGKLQIALDTDKVFAQFASSVAEGAAALADAGMSSEGSDAAMQQALVSLTQMLERKQLGDYVVVHPKTGGVITYRSEAT